MKTFHSIWLHLLLLTVFALIKTAAFAQLQAGFSATPQTGCPPLVVSFKDSSKGNPTSWKWDLGNGTISYLQNPINTYLNSGSYNIKLIVKNATSADSIVRSKYIVVNAIPIANFGSSQTGGCFPLDVTFKDSSLAGSGTITLWKWDFGDGTLSNERNPVHTYTNAGNFTVVLRVTNSNGCTNVISRPAYIKIQNGVRAEFSYESQQGCRAPASVSFTNRSAGTGVLNYAWNFGDGKTSNAINPVNNYQAAGVYTVKLIASNSFGCSDTLIKSNAINIGFVKADFSKIDTICAGTAFQLKNTSSPSTFVSSKWNFGDGTFSDSANPIKIYAAPGSYQVKLLTDFGSCEDSVVKPISVLAQPGISFTASNNTGCSAPLDVTFNNTTNGGISYLWNFGDSTTSTLENPGNTYKKTGEYPVTLTVKNASGCSASLLKQSFVKIIPPKITSINNLPLKGCIPSAAKPVAVISNNVAGSSYLWDFGDGATSTDSTPSHTYTTPGNYNIKLTLTTPSGCIDTLTIVKGAQVGAKPAAGFSADPLDACANTPVTFTDLSSGPTAQSWLWNFGDGGTSVEQNPVHAYNNSGKVNVILIVSNYGCSDTLKKINYINIRPPIAKFDTAFRCNDPLTRNFINKSVGALTWQWDFGDGSVSADSKVSHTYAAPGVYPVILKVTNGGCENTIKKDVVVINEQGNLQPGITESCVNTAVTFNIANINATNISSYVWYYNGLSLPATTGSNPAAFVYSTAGVRQVAAVVTDKLNCRDTLYSSVPVTIYGPEAGFGSSNPGTCFGNTVPFIDSAKTDGTHPIAQWKWNFGEGTSQSYTSAPFSHNYSAAGTYDVTLVVKDTYGCTDSLTKPAFISVTKPVANFAPSDTIFCPQSSVTFYNYSIGAGATYYWQFGDSATSGDSSPVHTYAEPGLYTVSLRIVDKNGCSDSVSSNIKIAKAAANFAISDSFSTCPPLIVNTANQSLNFVSYNWDFGDGGNSQLLNPSHIYTYPGIYTIKLTINNNGGCTDSLTRKVVIEGPTGVLNYTPKEACNPETVNFSLQSQNAVSYIWDYNDGTAIFSDKTTESHTYTAPGSYLPKIILQDTSGCKVPLSGIDTIKIIGTEADISSDTKLVCDSGYVAFRDSTVSNDIVSNWMWNFGDGTASTAQSPNHKFTDTGFYTVTLISKTRFGCADTAVNQKYIKIVSSPQVRITGDTAACEPAQLKFQGEFVRRDTSAVTWSWNFGNGKTSDVPNPESQTYTTRGTYAVTVKVTNRSGCYDSVVRQAIILPKPPVNAGNDTSICKFTAFTLHATGGDNYSWNAAPTLSCTNCATPTANPNQTITYHVLGKTTFGCTNEDSVTVKVQQPFKMEVSKDDTVCLGESVVLKATGAGLYKWTPSTWLDNANTGTPKSTPASSITYKVVGKDSLGCFEDEGTVNLKVYPKPVIEITNGENIFVQAGSSIKLVTKNSSDIINWKWYPSKWLSCDSCSEPIAASNDHITYRVTAANEGHCEAQDEVTLNIICNNANVFIPNTFSPNNDGTNDVFYPRGTGLYTIKSFKIFNRWGQTVFSRSSTNPNDPQNGWDGTSNGDSLPSDVYVYILEVICSNNTSLPVKGNVTLVR